MSRNDRLEELASALATAENVLMRAYVLSRDLGFADLAAELQSLISVLRSEQENSADR